MFFKLVNFGNVTSLYFANMHQSFQLILSHYFGLPLRNEDESSTGVQNPNKAVCISHNGNTLGKYPYKYFHCSYG